MYKFAFIVAAATAAAILTPSAWAAAPGGLAEAKRIHQRERAQCMRGESNQDRATCLKEAGAAYEEARKGALANAANTNLAANAVKRCDAQPAADREACMQRILGAGKTQGSVQGGGVIRQTETPVR